VEFGQLYAGPEMTKLLADFGADVIRVESSQRPEILRQAGGPAFVSLNRNKRSLGVDVKTEAGCALVLRLLATADVVVENMAGGAFERLGFSEHAIRSVNPRAVIVHSQLFGDEGPWGAWRGFGPLARGLGGLSALWRWPDDDTAFGDSNVVFPDHLMGRLGAFAALCHTFPGHRAGTGVEIRLSQVDAIINQLAEFLLAEALAPGASAALGNRSPEGAPWGVYPCSDEGSWCVITVRDNQDWSNLVEATQMPGWVRNPDWATPADRRARADHLDEVLSAWTRTRTAEQVMGLLQAFAVPAGKVQRFSDMLEDRQLRSRGFLRPITQPGADDLILEGDCWAAAKMPPSRLEHAPALGEHTLSICLELGMEQREVDELLAADVIETPPSEDREAET
jgi:crotonobetainyl-CoA:carnitine CoA-transferase CaiB-like acyl-CoA transferase